MHLPSSLVRILALVFWCSEEALAAWKEKARIPEMFLVKVSTDLDAKQVKTEVTQ
jgi:hypothetical protein